MNDTGVTEHHISDALSSRLDILEPGLRLLEREFYIRPRYRTTKSWIDILALDRYGNLVVIEVKRSNSAAREAIHEVIKYTAAVTLEHGRQRHQVRAILVSTAWDEMLRPFSEYASSSPYALEGYELEIDATGTPTRASKVDPLEAVELTPLCPVGQIFFYEYASTADTCAAHLQAGMENIDAPEFAVVRLDYSGTSPREGYNHANAVIMRSLTPRERDNKLEGAGEFETREEISVVLTDNPYYAEEGFLAELVETIGCGDWTDVEILYPEKLGQQLKQWSPGACLGIGSIQRMCDQEGVHRLLAEYVFENEQGHGSSFYGVLAPRMRDQWEARRQLLAYCLRGNGTWADACDEFLDSRTSGDLGDEDIAVESFNPLDVLGLIDAMSRNKPWQVPYIVCLSLPTGEALAGELRWIVVDTDMPDPHDLLVEVFGSVEEYALARVMHTVWEYEEALIARLGLSYEILRISAGEKDRGRGLPGVALEEFSHQNVGFVRAVGELLGSFSVGSS